MHTYDQSATGSDVPKFVTFFNNGMAAVCNAAGEQIAKYQRGIHSMVIESLARDGFDWKKLVVSGEPLEPHQFCDSLGRPIPAEMYGEYAEMVAGLKQG